MARFSLEARGALAGFAAVSFLAASCGSGAASPDTHSSRSPSRPGVVRIFAGYNGETKAIPPGTKVVIVRFTQQERNIITSGAGTVEDQLTWKGGATAVTPRKGLITEVRLPNSTGPVTSKVIIRA